MFVSWRHNAAMKTISIRELHEETDQWVRQAAQFGEILVTDSGKSVAKLLPMNEPPRSLSSKDLLIHISWRTRTAHTAAT